MAPRLSKVLLVFLCLAKGAMCMREDPEACPGFTSSAHTFYEAPGASTVGQPSATECCRACATLAGGCWAWAFCEGASCVRADGTSAEPGTCLLSTTKGNATRRGAWFEAGEDVPWASGTLRVAAAPAQAADSIWRAQGGPDGEGIMRDLSFASEENSTEDYLITMQAYLDQFLYQQMGSRQSSGLDAGPLLVEGIAKGEVEEGCGTADSSGSSSPRRRDNLVMVPVGDGFDASRWMSDPSQSNWDLIAVYYGAKESFACPQCKAVYRAAGPKWRLVFGLTLQPEWEEYRKAYKAIMLPDDDLTLDLCTANTVFNTLTAFGLLVAQPSVCNVAGSFTLWNHLYQQPQHVLRYTSMVEIMAPTFEMEFFHNFIRPSLHAAYFGWGLDFVWPYLLEYPQDKFAVVDRVCMRHPKSMPGKKFSLYTAAAPFSAKQEEALHYRLFNYTESVVGEMGFQFMPVDVFGGVVNPIWENSTRIDQGLS